jgi:hypothetical protein
MRVRHLVVVTALSSSLAFGAIAANNDNPNIVPIQGNGQKTYGDLAAAWWQWATETPAPQAALIDPTGANCANNQPSSGVWFLAGTLNNGDILTRACTVPSGRSLFFPVANFFAAAFLTDPQHTRTPGFLSNTTKCVIGADVFAEIDGVPVVNPSQYLEVSKPFTIHLPEDNVFDLSAEDVPELTLDPVVDRGYYLYVNPLSPGQHTIRFTSAPGTSTCTLTQDITYNLTIAAP